MSLLNTYEELKTAALAEQEEVKVASAEELEVIEKYASAADDLLANEFGEDYNEEDVAELATLMINHDAEEEEIISEEEEKTASLIEAGKVMAQSFLAEINKAG